MTISVYIKRLVTGTAGLIGPERRDVMSRRRGILYITGVLILVAPIVLWIISGIATNPDPVFAPVERSGKTPEAALTSFTELAELDPRELVHRGRERYRKEVHEYRCVLVKQERIGKKLSAVQEVEVRFRESPRMVYMLWLKNADQAKRALFMEDGAFVDKKGRKLARVEPAGAVVSLFVKDIMIPIHGPEARKTSRRSIDECGFGATFQLLERYNAVAAERGVLDLRYRGTGLVDGRPTYVIMRNLPYEGEGGVYPDARMIMHLDQEWLLPVAVYSYADHEEKHLLGSYVFTQIELNPIFSEDAFEF